MDANNGVETRLEDASSTAARFPASSSTRTQQHLGSDMLAGKKQERMESELDLTKMQAMLES